MAKRSAILAPSEAASLAAELDVVIEWLRSIKLEPGMGPLDEHNHHITEWFTIEYSPGEIRTAAVLYASAREKTRGGRKPQLQAKLRTMRQILASKPWLFAAWAGVRSGRSFE